MAYRLHCPAISCKDEFANGEDWAKHIVADHPLFVGAVFDIEGAVYAE